MTRPSKKASAKQGVKAQPAAPGAKQTTGKKAVSKKPAVKKLQPVPRMQEAKVMATTTLFQGASVIDQIGEAAGMVWHHLDQHGTTSLTKLVKELDLNRDQIMQAIGWLAREDKVALEDEGRTRVIRLRD